MPTARLAPVLALLLVMVGVAGPATAAPARQTLTTPVASYTLSARLDTATKQVQGTGAIEYRNPSGDTLTELWFHLYLNAFGSAETTWMRERGGSRFDPATAGSIAVTGLRIAGGADLLPGARVDETLLQVPLPSPLAPGDTLRLEVAWTSRLPRAIARTGYVGDYFLVGQWYPKLSVYDRGRWNNHQFHANAEFFADFGRYDVRLDVPEDYVTGATGVPAEDSRAGGRRTVRYVADDVTDFVWTACACLRERVERAGDVDIVTLVPAGDEALEPRVRWATEQAIRHFGEWWGRYPRPRITVLMPPRDAGATGGMEYPMFVTTEPASTFAPLNDASVHFLEYVTIHEVAHQWWPMVVQTNEMEEPWLDEGFTEFSGVRLMDRLWPPDRSMVDSPLFRLGAMALHRASYAGNPRGVKVYGPSWEIKPYAVAAYSKPALLLSTLEQMLGEERFLAVMRTYFQRWAFRHPRTEDFVAVANEVGGRDLTGFFDQFVYGTAVLDYRADSVAARRDGSQWTATVRATRTGDATLPTDVTTTLADGTTRIEAWDGAGTPFERAFSVGAEPRRLTVGPTPPPLLELNRLDNAADADPGARLADYTARLLPLFQAIVRLVGAFG